MSWNIRTFDSMMTFRMFHDVDEIRKIIALHARESYHIKT
jgi:hypothetical protein